MISKISRDVIYYVCTFRLAILAVMAIPIVLTAKDDPLSKFFEKFSKPDGVTFLQYNPNAGMMGGVNGPAKANSKELKEIMSNIKTIKILTTKAKSMRKNARKENTGQSVNLYGEALKNLPLDDFEKYLELKENGTNVKMLYKSEKDNKVHEFLMLIKENNETSVIWIEGVLDLKDLSKLPGILGVDKGKK